MIKVYVFHTGHVKVDQAIPHQEKNPLAVMGLFRGNDKKLVLPVSCYFIVHPMGNILIDTGWDTIYAKERPKQMFGMVDRISGPIIKEDEGIDSKLKQIGYKPSDIDVVFISHMDFDHTSGLRLMKAAKKVMTSRQEWDAANKHSIRYIDTWSGICNVETFEYEKNGIGPFGESYDVFKDGSIQLVSTPGHSKGLFSVRVGNEGKYVVLGNDGAYTPKSFEEEILPGFTVNNKDATGSLKWLCECRKDPNCLEVLANHDPTVKEHRIEL